MADIHTLICQAYDRVLHEDESEYVKHKLQEARGRLEIELIANPASEYTGAAILCLDAAYTSVCTGWLSRARDCLRDAAQLMDGDPLGSEK